MSSLNMRSLPAIPSVELPAGQSIPRLGLGTWRMGETHMARNNEVAVLRYAITGGITLIDTAEMYGEGGAEEVVGEAWHGAGVARENLFIVSKVYPWNASRRGTLAACKRSLERLGTDAIDLYLLHWRGEHPLADTVNAFEELKREGKIRHWGVSNFDTADMKELFAVTGGQNCAANQIYYNLARRWPEATLLPWLRDRGIATMAYSPLDQGRLLKHKSLAPIASRHGVTAAQVALAWLMHAEDVIAIPKTSRIDAVNEILCALQANLDTEDFAELQRAFLPPKANARMQTT